MHIDEIDLKPLLSALQKFENFRLIAKTEIEKAGSIQAFEYSYELTWKIMKRVLASKGVIVSTPKDVFREAAAAGIIDDPEIWFDFIKKRNLTVDTYQENEAENVIKIFPIFSQETKKFLNKIIK
jgi:nucleotidyltransferase substrate binding protein (TIGR01987 family)